MIDGFGEMLDVTPEARSRYYAILRRLTPEQRARKVAGLCRLARMLAIAGIRREHPGAGPDEVLRRLAVRRYGAELARRLSGGASSRDGR